jgi:hypothetical protein
MKVSPFEISIFIIEPESWNFHVDHRASTWSWLDRRERLILFICTAIMTSDLESPLSLPTSVSHAIQQFLMFVDWLVHPEQELNLQEMIARQCQSQFRAWHFQVRRCSRMEAALQGYASLCPVLQWSGWQVCCQWQWRQWCSCWLALSAAQPDGNSDPAVASGNASATE